MMRLEPSRIVVTILMLTLAVGAETILLIREIVPRFVFFSAVAIFLVYLGLLVACWYRVRAAFLANILVALVVSVSTLFSRAHLYYITFGYWPESAVIIAGYVLSASLILFSWKTYRELRG